ncbi:hypothetical protein SS1G_11265 [Sclerotinia sclerotiorum 1980 UF-70]|uniref:Uncharacterized protein n=2 Tax=Sclerotinia sclerotiorum (strain ATCC 18683 / 1980 / Ss-1) TaxID=665079 RepID=A7F0Z6_SCLS1|nr:hypothetical protein SS1G_11265 [Sclerotinia sclerotiorum 1980 UF-70]APA13941.1 hypothetical protein sscle_12g087110 [Sclerotinia sclerotiorum 1980 UF-70]EDN95388.1 hypothetical protein SS1G_11265 [Sclerotinia sclerotiorum 1980 UF-70]
MRPTTPNFNFAQPIGPSSPPETPTHSSFTYPPEQPSMNFSRPSPKPNGIIPNGRGPHFSYNRAEDLSPRSTSPSSESSGSASPPRSESSQPAQSPLSLPVRRYSQVIDKGNFTLEEITDSDLEDFDCNEELIIRPHQYEDAESDRGHIAPTPALAELDPHFLNDLRDLTAHDCTEALNNEDQDGSPLDEHEAWVQRNREERRRRRRSSATVQKRSLAQSIGSDTDDEDLQQDHLSANEAGSSARRLRRKTFNHGGDKRASLVFDDPPPRIPELEEPDSCDEVIEDDTEVDDLRELPYYVLEETMDLDSPF